ncbi:prepilin peptidase-dependent pilin [Salmonella enterica subsp. enterica serovar Choleraesuis]|nr:prepilin peptidase-dependent pilin [Salmonella enterica subsp. enterica serovar Choleraesuis]
MNRERGFTLIELMVVVGIVAVLSAIGIPTYQNYLRKAALTDMLQTFVPYRTAIALCAMDTGGLDACSAGTNGIPSAKHSRYVKGTTVAKGVVTLTGQNSLSGLTVVMTPQWQMSEGITGWRRECKAADAGSLVQTCEAIFQDNTGESDA